MHDMTPFTLFNASEGSALELLGTADELELGLTRFIVDEVDETRDVWEGEETIQYDSDNLGTLTAKLSVQVIDPSTKYPDETGQGAPHVDISGVPYAHAAYYKYFFRLGQSARNPHRRTKIYTQALSGKRRPSGRYRLAARRTTSTSTVSVPLQPRLRRTDSANVPLNFSMVIKAYPWMRFAERPRYGKMTKPHGSLENTAPACLA